ncbi:MAG: class I SAM-dependent methyltransferase, partial [Chloroflexales bacterium]|nr:class I SAM-dependent methyltransferase [Chloroflexales bacterium]
MIDQSAADAYDQVFYPSAAEPSIHPDRLATVATLFGVRPAPVDQCRVLELGCADGANLLPMAYALPHGTFFGIDASPRQIAAGQAQIAALGLKNVRLQALDLQELPASSGEFDYIIAHGVYSWVAPAVQEALLALCGRHLAANGVAVVSYNVLPGWHQRGVARDLLRFHTRQFAEP